MGAVKPGAGAADWPYQPEEWMESAACLGCADPDMFHPRSPGREAAKAAKAVCAGCKVASECGAYALAHGLEGVWGGLCDRERKALKRGGHAQAS